MSTPRLRFAPTLLVLLFCSVFSSTALSQEPAAAEAAEGLPPIDAEVGGTCHTPRQAYLQMLFWAKKDARKAALCFDSSGLAQPHVDAPDLAERMLEFLDAEDRLIDTDGAPTAAGYTAPGSGQHEYFDPLAPEFRIRRAADGRWLFTPESLARVPESSLVKKLASNLPGWFHSKFAGNEVWKYIGIIALIFFALFLQRMVVFFIRTYLKRLVGKTKLSYLNKAVDRADRPIGGLVMAGVFHLSVPKLAFTISIAHGAALLTKALAAYSIVWLGYRLIDVLAFWMESKAEGTSTKLDDQLVPLIVKTLKVFVAVLGGIFVLQNLSVDVGSLLAGVGLGGLAFALAAKDTIANFFGSVMIFIDKPFQIGDWIVVGNVEGTVEEVGFRTTRVRTFYNSLVTVPNASITTTNVDNYGMREYRRYTTTLGLAYDTPVPKVQSFCESVRALLSGMPGMRKDYYMVEFQSFGDSTLNILLYCFMVCDSWNDELRIRTHLNLEILRIAESLGVSFAFPTQTLHVDTMAKSGGHNPSHSGPTQDDELAAIVDGFAKGGNLQRYRGNKIADRYDNDGEREMDRW
ncbi:MAG: mechanosensitive ion channel family protein [Myxococcales bacterium]|nr:mechanosensitive ion channel family protein [Myxococcales bacterium]